MSKEKYKLNEEKLLKEVTDYVLATYGQHYSKTKFQSIEFIIDAGLGEGFCLGNIMKLAQRFGKKSGKNRLDLLKIIHYGIIMLYIMDQQKNEEKINETK